MSKLKSKRISKLHCVVHVFGCTKYNLAVTFDLQQCGILTRVDSHEPVQSFKA